MSAGGLLAAFSEPGSILGKFGRLSRRCGEQCAPAARAAIQTRLAPKSTLTTVPLT
jgi:hypothetical protein